MDGLVGGNQKKAFPKVEKFEFDCDIMSGICANPHFTESMLAHIESPLFPPKRFVGESSKHDGQSESDLHTTIEKTQVI